MLNYVNVQTTKKNGKDYKIYTRMFQLGVPKCWVEGMFYKFNNELIKEVTIPAKEYEKDLEIYETRPKANT